MTTDFRALCAELADELTQFNAWYIKDNGYGLPALEALLRRSDAALAEPDEPAVPEGREPASVISEPSDEELRDIWDSGHLPSNEQLANDDGEQDLQFLFTSAYYQWLEENPDAMAEHKTKCIRAVFNAGRRWGNPAPQPPADGEVAELAEWLREQLHVCLQAPWTPGIKHFGRAANLLERLSPPVPVSERLPGPEDCDAKGRCWVWWKNGVRWVLDEWTHHELKEGPLSGYISHWLPAHALPLPTDNG